MKATATKAGATHSVVYILVKGTGDVMDMLRYDNCVPADEGQSHKLSGACRAVGEAYVILKRFVPAGMGLTPTVERWKSFGWDVMGTGGRQHFDTQREAEECAVIVESRRVSEAAKRLGAP